jgi:hypothetical protein
VVLYSIGNCYIYQKLLCSFFMVTEFSSLSHQIRKRNKRNKRTNAQTQQTQQTHKRKNAISKIQRVFVIVRVQNLLLIVAFLLLRVSIDCLFESICWFVQ